MARRISETALIAAITGEVEEFERQVATALAQEDEIAVQELTEEVDQWRAKLAAASLTNLKPVPSLARRMAKLLTNLSLWLQSRPEVPEPPPPTIETIAETIPLRTSSSQSQSEETVETPELPDPPSQSETIQATDELLTDDPLPKPTASAEKPGVSTPGYRRL